MIFARSMVGMEMQQCKICFKKFSNGKAIGGHMRSHYAKLPLPPKRKQPSGDTDSTSSQFSTVEDGDKILRIVDPKFLDAKSTRNKNASQISSKKRYTGKPRSSTELFSGLKMPMVSSSVSEEEDGAWCLFMLSRNVWSLNAQLNTNKYQCETCEKVFKSAQGLGSHKTSHKKIRKGTKIEISGDGILLDLNQPAVSDPAF